MGTKNGPLHFSRREHTKIIQPKLTNSYHARLMDHLAKMCAHLIIVGSGVVGVDAHASKNHARVCLCQDNGGPTGSEITARINHAGHTTRHGSRNDGFAVSVETSGVNVGMAIDEQTRYPFHSSLHLV